MCVYVYYFEMQGIKIDKKYGKKLNGHEKIDISLKMICSSFFPGREREKEREIEP